jgi:hypothetical protein
MLCLFVDGNGKARWQNPPRVPLYPLPDLRPLSILAVFGGVLVLIHIRSLNLGTYSCFASMMPKLSTSSSSSFYQGRPFHLTLLPVKHVALDLVEFSLWCNIDLFAVTLDLGELLWHV